MRSVELDANQRSVVQLKPGDIITFDGTPLIRREIVNPSVRKPLLDSKRTALKDVLKHFSRILGLTVSIQLVVVGTRIGMAVKDNADAWQGADTLPNCPGLVFGGSFSLEDYGGLSLENYNTPSGQLQYAKAMADLKAIHEIEGINNLRIEAQMKNTIDKNGNFTSEFIDPEFRYLLGQKDMQLKINTGIKTFLTPEENVPEQYNQNLAKILRRDGVVRPEDLVAIKALQNQSDILNYLQSSFTEEELSRIKVLQFNNESKTRFGRYPVVISDEVNIMFIDNVMKNFPRFSSVTFLFNVGDASEIPNMLKLFQKLNNKYPNIKLQLGIDYYPFLTGDKQIPFVGQISIYDLPGIDHVDQLFYDSFNGRFFQEAKSDNLKLNYSVIIAELQAEPWGNRQLPGNVVRDFNYAVKRGCELFPSNAKVKEEDVWGWRYLMEHKDEPPIAAIIEEIRENNHAGKLSDDA